MNMNRVWTYTISRALSDEELQALRAAGNDFVKGWTAHDQQLTASFDIVGKRIVLVKVNEDVTGASGCSIDKLTRFIRQAEQQWQLELMNRLLVAYDNNNEINVVPSGRVRDLLNEGQLTPDTLVYNTAVANEAELQHWRQPLKESWLAKYMK